MFAARCIATALLAAVLSYRAAAQEQAGQPAKSRPPVAALLNLDRSAQGSLLEARLRREEDLRWWSRSKTADLLRSVALSPRFDLPLLERDEAESRSRLQTLILVKTFQRKEHKYLQVVLCDIEQATRLALYRAAVSEKASEVETLAAGVAQMLRARQPLREIWAVPPLVSRDLTHDFDDSAVQLAEEIENVFLSRDGAVAVEFEFAPMIDAARRAAGITEPLKRPLPAYVLGEYRNEGQAEKRTIALELQLIRGAREELQRRLDPASPDRALELVVVFANDAASQLKGAELLTDEQAAEHALLTKRRSALEQAGDWIGAWYLSEAQLLLDHNRGEIRTQAISALDKIAARHRGLAEQGVQEANRELAKRPAPDQRRQLEASMAGAREHGVTALNSLRRAIQHMQVALDGDKASRANWIARSGSLSLTASSLARPIELMQVDPDRRLASLWGELLLEHQSAQARLFYERARTGQATYPSYLQSASEDEHLNEALRAIVATQDFPNAEQRSKMIADFAVARAASRRTDVERFIAQLEAAGSFAAKAAAASARSQLAARGAPPPAPQVARPAEVIKDEPTEPAQIEFEEVKLAWKQIANAASTSPFLCQLCLAAGKADLFFGSGQILIMKQKGEAAAIWEDADRQWSVRAGATALAMTCFDGRYAWIPLSRIGKPQRLLMIDVENEKVIEWTRDDGLPLEASEPGRGGSSVLGVAPLAPGKVCVAGSSGRGWLATADYDPEKGKQAKVFFEAREEGRSADTKSTLAFRPTYIYTLAGDLEGKPRSQRILVGRYNSVLPSNTIRPLIVDPDTGKVEVVSTSPNSMGVGLATARGDTLYWIAREFEYDVATQTQKRHTRVYRLGFPDFQKHLVADHGDVRIGQSTNLGFDDRGMHCVGNPWFVASAPDKPLTRLRGKMPEARITYTTAGNVTGTSVLNQWQLAPSANYGWLIHQVGRVYAVKFIDSKEKPAPPTAEKE